MPEPSLAGRIVAVTADVRWEDQAEYLTARGAQVLHIPTIRAVPTGPDDELFAVTERIVLAPPRTVVAVTGIGMRAWFAAAESWGVATSLRSSLRRSRVVATPGAARALRSAGVDADVVVAGDDQAGDDRAGDDRAGDDRAGDDRAGDDRAGDAPVRAALLARLGTDVIGPEGSVVAVERPTGADHAVVAACRMLGASVVEVPVHRWVLPADLDRVAGLARRVAALEVDAVTFTSGPAVRNLGLVAEEHRVLDEMLEGFRGGVVAAAVGPVCVAAARRLGLHDIVVPTRYRVAAMLAALDTVLVERDDRRLRPRAG
jgi:uroporphyrinogen-III synthase